jgi:capsid protein
MNKTKKSTVNKSANQESTLSKKDIAKKALNVEELPSEWFEKTVFPDLDAASLIRYGFSSESNIISGNGNNKVNKTDVKILSNICQNLVDSNAVVSSILDILSTLTLGVDGPTPQPRVRKDDGSLDETLNNKISRLWDEYNDTVVDGETLRDLFFLEEQTKDVTGNVFIVYVDDESNKFRHTFRYFDTTDLDLTKDTAIFNEKNNYYINYGIKFDRNDKVKSYFFRNQDEIPASRVIHYHSPKVVNQKISLPVFSSAITTILNHKTLIKSATIAATLSAQLVYWLKPNSSVSQDVKNFITKLSENIYESDIGSFFCTENEPKNIAGNVVISQMTTQFSKLMLQVIAAGCGLSYDSVSRDFENQNFSTSRIISRLDMLTGKKRSKKFKKANFQKRWNRFIESIVTHQLIDIPIDEYEANRSKYQEVFCYINHPVMDDPVKTATTNAMNLKTGAKTLKQICDDDGTDWQEQIIQAGREARLRRENGIENELDRIHIELNVNDENDDNKKSGDKKDE